ncbi:MAG: diguanylate cyclase [Armatimonadetes bacterium]|nr:diguanylate cyclase [Armatimonadota bacterium]
MPFRLLPLPARLYILANILVSSALFGALLGFGRIQLDVTLLLLVLFTVVMNLPKVFLTTQNGRMTLGYTTIFLTILLRNNLLEAAVIGAITGICSTVLTRPRKRPDGTAAPRTWYRPALSVANLVQSATLSAVVWLYFWPQSGLVEIDTETTRIAIDGFSLLKLLIMTATYFIWNTGGVSFAVAYAQRTNPIAIWRENFLWTYPGFLFAICAATGCVLMIHSDNGVYGFLLLPPVYVVYYSYKLYLDKINSELDHVHDLNNLNERVISTLAMAIEAKDRYTHKHVERVREYAVAIARELGVTGPELEAVRIGAIVHDIGKIAVPEMILTKPAKLTHEEFERMKSHVNVGVKILEAVNFPFPVTDAVAAHHEHWDGNGYPNKLRGEEIPLVGRIVCLADGFDALTSDRPYRKRMTDEEALTLVRSQTGEYYDPKVVDALIKALPSLKPIIEELNRQEYQSEEGSIKRMIIPQEALEEIAHASEEAVALAEILLKPNSTHDPKEVTDLLLEKVMQLLPCTCAAVYILDEETEEIRAEAYAGLYSYLLEGLSMKRGEGITGWVVANSRIALNEPAANDLARRVEPGKNLELNSAISVPLQAAGRCIGAITLYHTGYDVYDSQHQRLLIQLADHASSALDTLLKLRSNQVMAQTDSLTELPNMRYLIQHLEEKIGTGEPFFIMMLDLNGFKKINDTYGHLEGDRTLCQAAQVLRESIRAEDLVGRYAGDEFVIVCHSRNVQDAYKIMDRIKEKFSGLYLPGDGSIILSASIGMAKFPVDGSDWRTLIAVADRRMYQEKVKFHLSESGEAVPGATAHPPSLRDKIPL